MTERVRVLLVFGGESSEHEVSCLTAGGVLRAADSSRYDITCVGITRGGRWVWAEPDLVRDFRIADGVMPSVDESLPSAVWIRTEHGADIARLDGDQVRDRRPVDVAFALLHGPFGEDGTAQGLFEMMGVKYVGSGVLTSAVCQDKVAMKQKLAACGLEVGPYVVVENHRWRAERDQVLAEIATLTYPLFVKPTRGGSSIGITRVTTPDEVVAAVEEARRFDPQVIVEQGFTDVREVECAVLGDLNGGEPKPSLPGEIIVHTESKYYDFETKYLPDQPVTVAVPADLPADVAQRVRRLAVEAFIGLGVEGLARVDTFVRNDGSVVVNELNTMPGFTATSMYPKAWEATGVTYSTLITTLVELARTRPLGLR